MKNTEGVLAILGGEPVISDIAPHYHWPPITDSLLASLEVQVHRSLSDRDASGIIGEFEETFAAFAGRRHAVAFSSGTGALHAMCKAAGLAPGDEILCCAYGFFASVSPFAYEGVRVVFCEADAFGNLSPHGLEAHLTPRTRAVMAVHIWGNPCDLDTLETFCRAHDLLLMEDCSHAHFASWGARRVGQVGQMAAFSLNQKAITAGEGGVLVTDNRRYRDLALLFGHYNTRAKRDIEKASPLAAYAFTGMGLKYRPHTIAMALALHQLAGAGDIEVRRRKNLTLLTEIARRHGVFQPIVVEPCRGKHGLYVLAFRVQGGATCRNSLFAALQAEGGVEFDVPGSTRLMQGEPLFLRTDRNSGWDEGLDHPAPPDEAFPNAAAFRDGLIKLPLWGYPGDEQIVEQYAQCLEKVSMGARLGLVPNV